MLRLVKRLPSSHQLHESRLKEDRRGREWVHTHRAKDEPCGDCDNYLGVAMRSPDDSAAVELCLISSARAGAL
jgi:hypothetical protein